MLIVHTFSPEETFSLAQRFAAVLKPGMVVTLSGELGAGKTVFAKGVARGLGISAHITSPTFTLINEYSGRVFFYHMDAYRLEDEDEVLELGFDEYFNSSGVTLVEWPERIQSVLPKEYIKVSIDKGWQDDGKEYRIISLMAQGDEPEKLIGEFEYHESTGS